MVEKEICIAYANLANAVIVSAINDYVNWKVQEYFYPPLQEVELMREEAKGDVKRYNNIRVHHTIVLANGQQAERFLKRDESIKIFTSFSSEELLSFADRKVKMTIEEMKSKGIKKRFRVGKRGVHE